MQLRQLSARASTAKCARNAQREILENGGRAQGGLSSAESAVSTQKLGAECVRVCVYSRAHKSRSARVPLLGNASL